MKKIDLDGALLWLGFGRGVCVVGSGGFAAVSWFSYRSGVLQHVAAVLVVLPPVEVESNVKRKDAEIAIIPAAPSEVVVTKK